MEEKEKLISVKEASKILGIKIGTLYQWHWLRINIPFIKVGKALKISKKDLMNFIERRKRSPEEV